MQELEVIVDYGDRVGEGPLWDEETGSLYWTDWVGRRFYRYHWASKLPEIVNQGIEVIGCAINRPGGFVVSNTKGIWLWDGKEEMRLLAGEVDGLKCQMNDGIADPVGRFLSGTCFYDPGRKYPLGHLIRVDTDGTATVLDGGIHLANGLAFSPDGRTLYFSDSAARRIYSYDYDQVAGTVRNRRTLIEVPAEEGLPDGMTVDADGFIWSAQWYGSCVVRYDPDGSVERRINTPAKQTSSVTFGGNDLTDLFITSAANSYPTPLMPLGYEPQSGYMGGALYHLNLDIQGKANFKTGFKTGYSPASATDLRTGCPK